MPGTLFMFISSSLLVVVVYFFTVSPIALDILTSAGSLVSDCSFTVNVPWLGFGNTFSSIPGFTGAAAPAGAPLCAQLLIVTDLVVVCVPHELCTV